MPEDEILLARQNTNRENSPTVRRVIEQESAKAGFKCGVTEFGLHQEPVSHRPDRVL